MVSHWGTARGWDTNPDQLPHCEPGPVEVVEDVPDPGGTAAGVRLLGEAERDDLNCWGSPAGGVLPVEMLLEEAWPRVLQAVTGVGEVGLKCGEGRGGVRQHGGEMQG